MDEALLRIGEIAAFFGVSAKALRLYEKMGIIKPAKTDAATGYRYYTADQIPEINALLELKSLGFSLAEIKSLISGETAKEKLIDALFRKEAVWEDAIFKAQSKIEAIGSMTARISESADAGKLRELSDEDRARLLAKLVCVEDQRGLKTISEAIWL